MPAFTPEEDRFIIKQRNEKARLWVSIANDLGTRNAAQVKERYEQITYELLYGRKRSQPTKVRCLGHGPTHYFVSADPRRFRLCQGCAELNKQLSGYGDFDLTEYTVENIEIAESLDKKPAELAEKDKTPEV